MCPFQVITPGQRIMLCHAWAATGAGGQVESGTDWYEVLAIETAFERGRMRRRVQVIDNGRIVTPRQVRLKRHEGVSVFRLFLTPWGRELDDSQLGNQGGDMEHRAIRLEQRRTSLEGPGRPLGDPRSDP